MKQTGIAMPGYQLNDYLLILQPPPALSSKISAVRDAFNKVYRVPSTPGKPNLLLCSFTQLAMVEERIVSRLRTIAMGFAPFKVELKNFGSFPSHTIYINVTSKLPIQSLLRKIRTDMQALLKTDNEHKPYFCGEPHFTLGRKLKPWQYEKAWLEYSQQHFTGRFIASEMLLLKRVHGTEGSWQVREHYTFQNLPVETKQGQLF